MNSAPLIVIARLRAKPGLEARLSTELSLLVEPTRSEPGCIDYDLHQSTDDPTRFMLHERWTGRQHLDDHLARPHVAAFLGQADTLLAEPPEVTTWSRIA